MTLNDWLAKYEATEVTSFGDTSRVFLHANGVIRVRHRCEYCGRPVPRNTRPNCDSCGAPVVTDDSHAVITLSGFDS